MAQDKYRIEYTKQGGAWPKGSVFYSNSLADARKEHEDATITNVADGSKVDDDSDRVKNKETAKAADVKAS
jgi:hypothetical protein